MMITVTTEVTEIDTPSQAHQQGQQDEDKLPLRLVETGHLL